MRRAIVTSFVWVAAVAVVVAAIWIDREWTPVDKRGGPPEVLVIALLALLALLLRPVREAAGRIIGLKIAGLEVTLVALADAATDPIAGLRLNPEEGDLEDDKRTPRIIQNTEARWAEVSVAALSTRLGERIGWIWNNLPDLGDRPRDNADAVGHLERAGLMPSVGAEILRVVATIDGDAVARARAKNPEALERFLEQADAVVYNSRMLAFDAHVRQLLRAAGYVLVDWRPQKAGRWPDFLAHRGAANSALWIAVRVAQNRNSALFKRTVDRLSRPENRTEVPGGPDAVPLIVVPNKSKALLDKPEGVKVLELKDLKEHVA